MGFTYQGQQDQSIFYTQDCIHESIVIYGLKTGEKLVSTSPFMIYTDNGLAIGLNESFTQFELVNQEGDILNYIHLNWSKDCDQSQVIKESTQASDLGTPSLNLPMIGLGLIIFIVLGVMYAKNR